MDRPDLLLRLPMLNDLLKRHLMDPLASAMDRPDLLPKSFDRIGGCLKDPSSLLFACLVPLLSVDRPLCVLQSRPSSSRWNL